MTTSRIAVIHKPYFLPWMGYFSKLLYADVFIVQDNVLASNRVWINRSQIIRSDGHPGYITLPIGKKGDAIISTIELNQEARIDSTRRITMSIEHAYSRGRFFDEWTTLKAKFVDIMEKCSRLVDIDVALINIIVDYLKIPRPEIYYASNLKSGSNAIDTIISNCMETQCNAIILGKGNSDWSQEDTARLKLARLTPLSLDFYGHHPTYYQTRRQKLGFFKGLSIIDCILNEGPRKTASLLADVPYQPHATT